MVARWLGRALPAALCAAGLIAGGYATEALGPAAVAAEDGPAPRPQWSEYDLESHAVFRARSGAAVGCRTLNGFAAWDSVPYLRNGGDVFDNLRRSGECITALDTVKWAAGPLVNNNTFMLLCRNTSMAPSGCYLFRRDAMVSDDPSGAKSTARER